MTDLSFELVERFRRHRSEGVSRFIEGESLPDLVGELLGDILGGPAAILIAETDDFRVRNEADRVASRPDRPTVDFRRLIRIVLYQRTIKTFLRQIRSKASPPPLQQLPELTELCVLIARREPRDERLDTCFGVLLEMLSDDRWRAECSPSFKLLVG